LLFQILKAYIMKLPLLFCALVLSLQGWCASVIPSHSNAQATMQSHRTAEMIGVAAIIYLAAVIWWAITAKNSLDKVLKDVLQSIAALHI